MSCDLIVAERDFLLARALYDDHTWVGMSSDEMVRIAIEGSDRRPSWVPADQADLGRCEETYRRAPEHLKARMLPILELFRRIAAEPGLWCFECHGGHISLWSGLCKEHAAAAGIDVRPIWEREPDFFERSGRPRGRS